MKGISEFLTTRQPHLISLWIKLSCILFDNYNNLM